MAVLRRHHHAPAERVLVLLGIRPGDGLERSFLAVQTRIILVGMTRPMPGPRLRGQDPDFEGVAAIPEAVAALVEFRPLQVHPDLHGRVRIVIGLLGGQGDLDLLPHVNRAGLLLGRTDGETTEAQKQGESSLHHKITFVQ